MTSPIAALSTNRSRELAASVPLRRCHQDPLANQSVLAEPAAENHDTCRDSLKTDGLPVLQPDSIQTSPTQQHRPSQLGKVAALGSGGLVINMICEVNSLSNSQALALTAFTSTYCCQQQPHLLLFLANLWRTLRLLSGAGGGGSPNNSSPRVCGGGSPAPAKNNSGRNSVSMGSPTSSPRAPLNRIRHTNSVLGGSGLGTAPSSGRTSRAHSIMNSPRSKHHKHHAADLMVADDSVVRTFSTTSLLGNEGGSRALFHSKQLVDAKNAGIYGNMQYLNQVIFAQGTPAAVFLEERRPLTLFNIRALPKPSSVSRPVKDKGGFTTVAGTVVSSDDDEEDAASPVSPCDDYNEAIKQQFGTFLNWAVHSNQVDVVGVLLANMQLDLEGDAWEDKGVEHSYHRTVSSLNHGGGGRDGICRLPSTNSATTSGDRVSRVASLNPLQGFSRHLLVIAARSNLPLMSAVLLQYSRRSGRSPQQQKYKEYSGDGGGVAEAALIYATMSGFTDVVQVILESETGQNRYQWQSNPNPATGLLMRTRNQFGDTLLHIAAAKGHRNLVAFLLHLNPMKMPTCLVNHSTCNTTTSLVQSDSHGGPHHEGVPSSFTLLNAKGQHGWTALMIAIEKKHTDLAEQLLDVKADVTIMGVDGSTALHRAAVHGLVDIVKRLLKAEADVLAAGGKDLRSPLHVAACTNQVVVASVLILGINWRLKKTLLDARDTHGYTAIQIAAAHGFTDFFKLLLKHGACLTGVVNPRTTATPPLLPPEAHTVFTLAAKANGIEIVKILFALSDQQEQLEAPEETSTGSTDDGKPRRLRGGGVQEEFGMTTSTNKPQSTETTTPNSELHQGEIEEEDTTYSCQEHMSNSRTTTVVSSDEEEEIDYASLISHATSKGFVELEQLLLERQKSNFAKKATRSGGEVAQEAKNKIKKETTTECSMM